MRITPAAAHPHHSLGAAVGRSTMWGRPAIPIVTTPRRTAPKCTGTPPQRVPPARRLRRSAYLPPDPHSVLDTRRHSVKVTIASPGRALRPTTAILETPNRCRGEIPPQMTARGHHAGTRTVTDRPFYRNAQTTHSPRK
uniref:Uncharacterized protein n=1 Tax=Nelumbo nucifera TaxID=4432 RepID=A0A822XWS1_NELNU|nr:TPA_asm: hypothetical protein HUJ06_025074 [Nelumbo nucifera]